MIMLGETAIYIKEHLMTELRSLKPEDILTVLDLSGEGLAKVKTAADAGDRLGAL